MRIGFAALHLPECNSIPRDLLNRLWTGVLISFLWLLVAPVWGQTLVSGVIDQNTNWTAAGAPYIVAGDVSVQGGSILTIEPGVTIYMSAGTSLSVMAGGVKANGTAASPVRVLSDRARVGQSPAPGDWNHWAFGPGASNTRLEHVIFEHGKGLVVNGSAPVFNHLDIRNQQGIAIAIDLAASPSGVGNSASGNTLNGISVPAGDITGSTRWGLRGIPYVVTGGTVSVGVSPTIQSVSPATVEQGQTLTLTIAGTRLTGLSKASFDSAGLTLTPFGSGSSSQAFLQLKVASNAPVGPATLRLQVDAGELVFPNAVTVTQPQPAITAISPNTVLAGTGATAISLTGRNFVAASEVLFNAASVPTEFVSATELRATLPNQSATGTLQVQVRSPDPLQSGQYLTSNQVTLSVQAPVPPTVGVEPAPIALPPDSKAHDITVRLSKADYRDNTLNVSISDTSKATVTPNTLVIPAGQTTATLTIVPKTSGTVSLVLDSPTLGRVTASLFITADFRGVNTSYAKPVGVVLQAVPGTVTRQVTVVDATVGVSIGGVLTGMAPSAWAIGSSSTLTISGVAIPADAQVSLVPSTGVTVDSVVVSGDGTQLQLALTAASNAPIGARRLVVKDAAGKELLFANPANAMVQLMTGLPAIDSLEPVVAARGSLVTLLVRGRHLQQGMVRILPDAGLRIDTAPQVSSDGTSLTVRVDVAPDAPLGARVVQIVTPAGASTATAEAANTLSIVSALRQAVTPIASPAVGVLVGNASRPAEPRVVQPGSGLVGVLFGAGITEVMPSVGVVGTDVPVTVRGAGLQGASVSFSPSAGLSIVGSPTVNDTGNELSFTLRVDAEAVLGLRKLVISVGGKPLATVRPSDGAFLVSAPIPELLSVAPQILRAGQPAVKFSVRGRNLANVSAVRIEPQDGITVSGPFESTADTLSFFASAASGAASGARTVIVTTAAGESTATQTGENIVRVATEVGPTYADISSRAVGVTVGTAAAAPESVNGTLTSTAIGVMVGSGGPPRETLPVTVEASAVGVVLGAAAQTMVPNGWLQGASGDIVISGQGLDTVASVTVLPATGVLLGTPVAANGGAMLTVPISVAPDAIRALRELRMATASGGRISFSKPEAGRFGIGSLPTMNSLSPIVFERGKGVVLTVRGSDLRGVTRVGFSPDSGIRTTSDIAWSQDGLGELITVSVHVDADAHLGNRVVRLEVPGGSTPADATPSNTINVVTPQ